MRFLGLFLCFGLAACATEVDSLVTANTDPPDPVKVVDSLKSAAAEAKLQEPLEVTAPIKAPAVSSVPWIICLRSAATEESKRVTYSVFFKNNDRQSFRLSAIIEGCGAQPFSPLAQPAQRAIY